MLAELGIIHYSLIWYGFGLLIATILYAKKYHIIKVDDIPTILLSATLGPLWLLITLFELLGRFFKRYKNFVLWRSQRKKTEHILFGQEDQEKPTPPWGL